MSKASEWAKTKPGNLSMHEIETGLAYITQGAIARVTVWPTGVARLTIWTADDYSHATFDDPLALARWILDTFGEPDAAARP